MIFGNADGEVEYYSRRANGELHYEGKLQANGQEIVYNTVSSVAIVDWNNDGRLDMVLGSKGVFMRDGKQWREMSYSADPIRLYLNQGAKTKYLFKDYSLLELDGTTDGFRSYAHVYVTDLDQDGKKDLLVSGRYGYADDLWNAFFFRNIGTDAAPVLDKSQIVTSNGEKIIGYFGPTWHVADWNKDGVKDLIFGMMNKDYNVKIFLGKGEK